MRDRILMIGAAAAIVVAAACGDSNGPGGASSVALLVNPNFVSYDTADYGSEGSEMEHTLRSFGVDVHPITAYDSVTIDSILSLSQAFVLPELNNAFQDSLTPATRALLRHWVDSSGGLLIFVSTNEALALLDSLWGHAITSGNSHNTYPLVGAAASGTAFAGGPSLVWDNDGTYLMDGATLPAGSHAVYAAGTDVAVSVTPQGRGAFVLIAWDWYNAAPHGSQDGGWIEVLKRALRS